MRVTRGSHRGSEPTGASRGVRGYLGDRPPARTHHRHGATASAPRAAAASGRGSVTVFALGASAALPLMVDRVPRVTTGSDQVAGRQPTPRCCPPARPPSPPGQLSGMAATTTMTALWSSETPATTAAAPTPAATDALRAHLPTSRGKRTASVTTA